MKNIRISNELKYKCRVRSIYLNFQRNESSKYEVEIFNLFFYNSNEEMVEVEVLINELIDEYHISFDRVAKILSSFVLRCFCGNILIQLDEERDANSQVDIAEVEAELENLKLSLLLKLSLVWPTEFKFSQHIVYPFLNPVAESMNNFIALYRLFHQPKRIFSSACLLRAQELALDLAFELPVAKIKNEHVKPQINKFMVEKARLKEQIEILINSPNSHLDVFEISQLSNIDRLLNNLLANGGEYFE